MSLFSLSAQQNALIDEILAKTPDLNKLLPFGTPPYTAAQRDQMKLIQAEQSAAAKRRIS